MGNDKILDVACGTGIIMRVIGERNLNITPLAGIDINESMLEMARELTKNANYRTKWCQGKASNLPFEMGSFSKCFCQQGLQYFPDKIVALSEMRRVLVPNGKLIVTVWSDISTLIQKACHKKQETE